jgi:hypothetical protein
MFSKPYSQQPVVLSNAKSSRESLQQVNSRSSPADHNRTVQFCSLLKLYRGETLTLRLPVPHGADLAVVGPDGTYLFIAFSEPNKRSPVQPIIDEETFRNMTQVRLVTTNAKGVPWVLEKKPSGATRRIFTKTGRYRVLLSQALETEDPILDASCEVDYVNVVPSKVRRRTNLSFFR